MTTDAVTEAGNYTNSDYIPITDGDVVIWDSYGYFQHSTNITSYEDYADQTQKLTVGFTDDHRTPVVKADLQHTRNLVATFKIHHRGTRSINILRTTFKVIAGTPDFDDWEKIRSS